MRPSLDAYFSEMARLVTTHSTCIRRAVGCVLVSARGHVLATGYNGVAAGLPHCNESRQAAISFHPPVGPDRVQFAKEMGTVFPHACAGHDLPAGQDGCEAIHAEQNALLQCRDPWAIEACYVTLAPCVPCTKLLLNTSCRRIVHGEAHGRSGLHLWSKASREATFWPREGLGLEKGASVQG